MTKILGMAIKARPAGTWSGPTLLGRILPDPINNRVGYGSFKKKTQSRFRSGSGFCHTRPGTDPFKYKTTKNPLYIKTKETLLPQFLSYSTLSRPTTTLTHSLTFLSLSHSPLLTNSTSSSDLYHRRHHKVSQPASSVVTVNLKLSHCRSQDRHRFVSLFLCLL